MTERLAILTRQIGHYHNARYKGAAETIENITVISTAGQGEFKEFLARDPSGYDIVDLFTERSAYDQAVQDGTLSGALTNALAKIDPTVIAGCGWANPESMAAIKWAKSKSIPLIMLSESQIDDAPRRHVQELVKRRIVSMCDAALVGGDTHAQYIKTLGMPSNNIAFGYNAIDNDHFWRGAESARRNPSTTRSAHSLPERYILASGRFIEKKNFPALIDAYASAVAQAPTSPDLVILGDGIEKQRVVDAINETGLTERIHLLGYRTYDDLPTLYALSEAFIHVSVSEQWGLVINEAMSAGVPVIASSKCGATRTLMTHGVEGYIVEPDVASITDALAKLFTMSPSQREHMGMIAKANVADWGPRRFGAGMRMAVDFAMASTTKKKLSWLDRSLLARLEQRVIQQVA